MRVLTFNVQNDSGDPRRTGLINAELRRLAPDLVALQEVTGEDQLAALLDGTGLHGTHQTSVLGYEPPYADRYGGTAVATRWPHRVVEVADHRGDLHWWTLVVSVALPDVGELLFIVPTTPWQLDASAARERQAVEVTELDARHRTALPTIIAGDLNAAPESASIRYLSGLQALAGRAQIVAARLVGDRPVDGVWLSDHAGVLVDLELGGNDSVVRPDRQARRP
jgi:endonuclease/exonuclease/phosphatase family metal-dependent hydrolase